MNFSQRAVSIRNFTKANLQSKTVSHSDTIIKTIYYQVKILGTNVLNL
jgi:hypothetical protein